MLEGRPDLRALTMRQNRQGSQFCLKNDPPRSPGPLESLLMSDSVFHSSMPTRNFHSACDCVCVCVCERVRSAQTESRCGSLFVHKCKFRILHPCHINETEAGGSSRRYLAAHWMFYSGCSRCWMSCSSLHRFINKQSVNSLTGWRTGHRFVVSQRKSSSSC